GLLRTGVAASAGAWTFAAVCSVGSEIRRKKSASVAGACEGRLPSGSGQPRIASGGRRRSAVGGLAPFEPEMLLTGAAVSFSKVGAGLWPGGLWPIGLWPVGLSTGENPVRVLG